MTTQSERGYAGECTARCVCCGAKVVVFAAGMAPFILHGQDRVSGEPCPRRDWPFFDAVRTDDDA